MHTTLEPRDDSSASVVYWPSYPDVSNPALPVRSTPAPGSSAVKLPWGIYTAADTSQVIHEASVTSTSAAEASSAPTASSTSSKQSAASVLANQGGILWLVLATASMVVVGFVLTT